MTIIARMRCPTIVILLLPVSQVCRLIRFARQRRRAAQQTQLAPPRFHQMAAQVAVRGIGDERYPRLADGLIDDLEVVLDNRDRRGVELPPPVLQRLLEIRHRGVVLRVGEAHGVDARVAAARLGTPEEAPYIRGGLGTPEEAPYIRGGLGTPEGAPYVRGGLRTPEGAPYVRCR